jgi:uncharacterized protein with GYD domain
MNRLILCEGATDAILLSYYLGKTAGWTYCRGPKDLQIRPANQTETVNWYKRDNDYLLICAVGGKDNFKRFFCEKMKAMILNANAFARIAAVTDRDDRKNDFIQAAFRAAFEKIAVEPKCNEWTMGNYTDSFGIDRNIEILLCVIPSEHQGALETVMLNAIAEDPYDRNIVQKTGIFAEKMRVEAGKYIQSDRLQLKAHLGLTWAVQYPEKVFSLIDEQIQNVSWEKSAVLKNCFGKLIEI